jgi:transcriptional regulator with XRE-family HTH domain
VAPGTVDPDQLVSDVCGRIREIRVAQGFTQKQVAERLGITLRAYLHIEKSQNLTLITLARVANALGVLPVDLFTAPAPHEARRGRPPKGK